MADDPAQPPIDPRMVDLVREAIARGGQRTGYEEPIDKPPTFTARDAAGFSTRDAALIREISRQMVDERLRERRLLSDLEIESVAKDIARTIFEQAISDVRDEIRTEQEIEAIVVAKLKEAGIRADEAHIDDTRATFEGLQRSHKRRADLGEDFLRELIKALATWVFAAAVGAVGSYLIFKGAPR